MKNQWKLMAGLGLAIIALGGLATWDEWKTKREEKEKETKGLLLPLRPDSVVAIHITSQPDSDNGEKTPSKISSQSETVDVVLKRDNDSWMIKNPIVSKADQQVVTDLLKSITEYKTESEVARGRDRWQVFGLDAPRRKIELQTNDGKTSTFLVGINAPVGFSAYTATSQSDIVYSGSQYIATSTHKTLFDLRDKTILHIRANEITEISGTVLKVVDGKDKPENLTLTKTNDQWQLTTPVTAKGDLTIINNFIDDLTRMKAVEFVDRPDSKFVSNLKSAKKIATWLLKSGTSDTKITISEFMGATYASVDGVETKFKISDDQKSTLVKSPRDFRDKRIFGFESAQVTAVEIDGQSFKKIGSEWYPISEAAKFDSNGKFNGNPDEQPKPAAHIRGLVVDLEYARAEDILDNNSKEAKVLPPAPLHQISLTIGQSAMTRVEIWKAANDSEAILLRESGKSNIYRAKRTVIASISPTLTKPVGDELMPQGDLKN